MEENTRQANQELRFQGTPVSDGIAIGHLYYLSSHQEELIPEFDIATSEVGREINRYRSAISSSKTDLEDLQSFMAREGSTPEAISIIDTHIQMLDDPFMTSFMEEKISGMLQNTESVFKSVMKDYEVQFSRVNDNFFQQRLLDVKDLSKRIMRHLYPRRYFSINDIPEDSIVFAPELVPSDTAEASSSRVSSFISQFGGGTSHAALIARSKGIPYVTSIDIDVLKEYNAALTIVDGTTGEIILNPSEKTLKEYEQRQEDNRKQFAEIIRESDLPTRTADGTDIEVLANIESLDDLDLLHLYHAKGIGLFRSEFLFLQKEVRNSSEEEQFLLYREIVKRAEGLPIVFRLFDVGGDKEGVTQEISEVNPALGCRAIRFLLRHRDIFRIQVRAILRAAVFGNVKLLIPLVSDYAELIETKKFIHIVREELLEEGQQVSGELLIGSMMEVPSAVITSDEIAEESDFLSIGTNDLLQYTLAADRCNPMICNMYKPSHPSIIKMIQMIIESGKKKRTPVSLCGEIGSNPLFIPLLLGLGLKSFSCAPRHIPIVKRIIRKLHMKETEVLAKQVLRLRISEDIHQLLSKSYDEIIRRD